MKRIPITESLQNVLDKDFGTVTFYFEEGGMQSQPLNPAFFKDEKGKDLALEKVAIKINEISHDLGAKYYIVE